MKIIDSDLSKEIPVPDKYVKGTVTVKIFEDQPEVGLHISEVYFNAGSHTHWHIHPSTQILTGKSGTGFVQKKGEEPIKIKPGEMVIIYAGEVHWHGAGKNESFVHTAIQVADDEGTVIHPLTEAEYNQINVL